MGQKLLGGSSSSSGNQLAKLLLPSMKGLLQPGTGREDAMKNLMLDPEMYNKVGEGYARLMDPSYTQNMLEDPTITNFLDAMMKQTQLGLGQSNADLRSRFAQGGQTQTAGSSPLLQAQAEAGANAMTGLNAVTAPELMKQLMFRQGQSQTALGQQQGFQMTPVNLLQALQSIFNKQKSTTRAGTLPVISSAASSLFGSAPGGQSPMASLMKMIPGMG